MSGSDLIVNDRLCFGTLVGTKVCATHFPVLNGQLKSPHWFLLIVKEIKSVCLNDNKLSIFPPVYVQRLISQGYALACTHENKSLEQL